MSVAKKEPLKSTLTIDKQILALFPTFNFDMEKNAKRKASIKKRLRVLKIVADQTVKKQFENINQYYLTKKVHPAIGGGTANGILKDLVGIGILRVQKARSKKKQTKFLTKLTAKGVIACMTLTDLQSPSKVKLLLEGTTAENQPLNTLANLLSIYNEGYVRFGNNSGEKISDIITVLHELTIKGRLLDFAHMSEDAIENELRNEERRSFVEKLNASQTAILSLLIQHSDDNFVRILKLFNEIFPKEKRTKENIERIVRVVENLFVTLTSPEVLVFIETFNSFHPEEEREAAWKELGENLFKRFLEENEGFQNIEAFEPFLQKTLKSSETIPRSG
jgi:nucleoside diphosphate kinase